MVCKDKCKKYKRYNMWGFILTMWYVKGKTVGDAMEALAGFILTMWYVKKVMKGENIVLSDSFILTMWYVKCAIIYINIFIFCVLY